MYCQRCGGQLADGNNFCPYCGTPIDGANAGQTYQSQSQYQYQQPNYQNYQGYQNGYQYYPPNGMQTMPGKGYGIASLVLGICSIPFYVSPVIGLVLGIIGLVFGISSSNSAKRVGLRNGVATAGIVCSAIGVSISGIIILWALFVIGILGSLLS